MKFSILIAHYNNWDFFQECYQGILNQTYQDYEIVIVDDFSLDGSYEKLVDLSSKDCKIKLFRNSENKKVGFTKRRCINEALGEVCLFVDPDDKISTTALIEIAEAYHSNKSIIATYSKIELINENSQSNGEFKATKKIKNSRKLFFNINFKVAHLFSFNREIYNKTTGINENLTSAVDQDLYLKLYEQGDFYFIRNIQYFYRLHNKGVSQDKSKKSALNSNWHQVLLDTCKRREITSLYGKNINEIDNLPFYIFKKENSLVNRIIRKLL